MAVIDAFTYNGEEEMLDIHLHALDEYVDKFVIVEAATTFSGHRKPLYFFKHERRFKKFWHKIDYHIINEKYTQAEIEQAECSPNTLGARHWKIEFLQKESIKKALRKCDDDDIVYIGDVDEIWEPCEIFPWKLKLRVYAYYLNNASNEEFWGTVVAPWSYFKDKCLNHVRSDTSLRSKYYNGWHFTSMGGVKEVQRKLNDSYTTDTYNTLAVQLALPERHKEGLDYLGRPFEFKLDESKWPDYLKENRFKYEALLKPYGRIDK